MEREFSGVTPLGVRKADAGAVMVTPVWSGEELGPTTRLL